MDDRRLRTYLNDHLAGATAAVSTLVRLAAGHAGDPFGPRLERLRDEVRMDREALRDVLRLVPGGESPWKRALGLAGSLVAWSRQMVASPGREGLAEELEALAIGVWGKRLLWGALLRLAERDRRFSGLDLETLIERAQAQEKELLRLRDEVLAEVLDPPRA